MGGARRQVVQEKRDWGATSSAVLPVQGYRVAVKKLSAAKVASRFISSCRAVRLLARMVSAGVLSPPRIHHKSNRMRAWPIRRGPLSEVIPLVEFSRRKRRLLLDPALNQS